MKRFTGVLAAVFLIFLSLQGLQGIAGDRAYSGNAGVKKAGALPAASKKKAAVKTTGQSKKTPAKSARSEEVPVPRAKPESAPAKKASASTTRSVDKKKAATAIVNFNRSTSRLKPRTRQRLQPFLRRRPSRTTRPQLPRQQPTRPKTPVVMFPSLAPNRNRPRRFRPVWRQPPVMPSIPVRPTEAILKALR